jgi:uncharacterized repeat protein (TIGR04138 family)
MQEQNFEDILDQIIAKDPRYRRGAYYFLREALDFTQRKVAAAQGKKQALRHVSGQELLDGIRDFGCAQFGPMALTVLEEWGVRCGEDFGEIVFNLVESGQLSKTDKDSRNDFKGGYAFDDAFRKPFLPKAKLDLPAAKPGSAS